LTLTGDRHHADILVEEAIIRILSGPQAVPPGTKLKVWMLFVLHHIHSVASRSAENQTATQPMDDQGADGPTMSSSPKGRLVNDDFRKAFWRLDAHEREMLILEAASGLSRAEVATVCDCTTGMIDVVVSRARQKLLLTLYWPSNKFEIA
jgi:RNA polymerase sigma-70 factor (ECF subfamily)